MTTDRHGWTEFTGLFAIESDGGALVQARRIAIAPLNDRRSCVCTEQGQCHRLATQEDFLCDECRVGEH